MRVLVCGSRTYPHVDLVYDTLDRCWALREAGHEFLVIEGGAPGADRLAYEWCRDNDQMDYHLQFVADWATYGKRAGPIRNQTMIDEGKPDICYAFIDKPLEESRGTNDMVFRCRKAGVPVIITNQRQRA